MARDMECLISMMALPSVSFSLTAASSWLVTIRDVCTRVPEAPGVLKDGLRRIVRRVCGACHDDT